MGIWWPGCQISTCLPLCVTSRLAWQSALVNTRPPEEAAEKKEKNIKRNRPHLAIRFFPSENAHGNTIEGVINGKRHRKSHLKWAPAADFEGKQLTTEQPPIAAREKKKIRSRAALIHTHTPPTQMEAERSHSAKSFSSQPPEITFGTAVPNITPMKSTLMIF